jgi:WD40 repeat protein/class 3 adenylate cyclase/tRNA A-37 threonylcarbamoyl transferase component Bud32
MFTDIVGCVALNNRVGQSAYMSMIRRHDELIRAAIASESGAELLKDTGDGCFASFPTASAAVRTALRMQQAIRVEPWHPEALHVRIGIHLGETGEMEPDADGEIKLVGLAVDTASRVTSLAIGEQILLTREVFNDARQFVESFPAASTAAANSAPNTLEWMAHGPYLLQGYRDPIDIFEVGATGTAHLSPPADSGKGKRVLVEIISWRPAVGLEIPGRPGWRLEKKLGEGGFGEVWLGIQKELRDKRVFKFCFDAERLRSIKREITIIRLLREALGNRKDVVRLYDVKLDKAPFFLESEYTEGGNLVDWAAKKGGIAEVPLQTRLNLFAGVVDAVAAAHSVGVLHKDIKPSNILIYEEEGRPCPRLGDFGIGMILDSSQLRERNITDPGLTIVAQNNSSPTGMYAPPELLTGQPFTVQGDVYALGVLLYQLVVADFGRPIGIGWERDVDDELMREDIAACVEGKPDRRLQSAGALAERVRSLQKRRDKKAADERAAAAEKVRVLMQLRRRRAMRLFVALSTLLLILLTGFIWAYQRERALRIEADDALGESLVSQGDALGMVGRWDDARDRFERARKFGGLASLNADLGLWNLVVDSPPPLLQFDGHGDRITSVAISQDGRIGLSGSYDNTLKLWDLTTGKLERRFIGHTGHVNSVVFCPDGITALSGSSDNTLILWDLATAKQLQVFSGHTNAVTSVVVSKDGKALSGSTDGTMRLWDIKTGDCKRIFPGHGGEIYSVALSPEGDSALSGNDVGTVEWWKFSGGEPKILYGHDLRVTSVAFLPDGHHAISASYDTTIKRWNLDSGQAEQTFSGHTDYVTSMACSADGRTALSGSFDHTLRQWDINAGKELWHMQVNGKAWGLAVSHDGAMVLAGNDNALGLWLLGQNLEKKTMDDHQDHVKSIALSPDGRIGLSGKYNGSLKLWDLATGNELKGFSGHNGPVNCVAFSPDGASALSGSEDNSLVLWNLASGNKVPTFGEHNKPVICVAFSPDGHTAVSGGMDHKLMLWDLVAGQRKQVFSENASVSCVAFTPGGRSVISGCEDGSLHEWDLAAGASRVLIQTHRPISAIAICLDGATVLCGSSGDGTIQEWNLISGARIADIKSHTQGVLNITICSDGRTARSGSSDKTIKVWDLKTGNELRTFSGQEVSVSNFISSTDGSAALTANYDGWVKHWDFARAHEYWDYFTSVPKAQLALSQNSQDAPSLVVLGNWYAFRGVNGWAIDILEQARKNGAEISNVTLARCYWNLHKLIDAQREFEHAIKRKEAGAEYLKLCLDAVLNEQSMDVYDGTPPNEAINARLMGAGAR